MSRFKTLITHIKIKHEQEEGIIDKGATYLYFTGICPETFGIVFLRTLPYSVLKNPVLRYDFVVQTTRGWPCLDLNDLPQN